MTVRYHPSELVAYWVPFDSDADPLPPVMLSGDSLTAGARFAGEHVGDRTPQRLLGNDHVILPELRNGVTVTAQRTLYTADSRSIAAGEGVLVVANTGSGMNAAIPMMIPDDLNALVPLSLPRNDVASLNVSLASTAAATWGRQNVRLPVAQGNAVTFDDSDGGDLWQLFAAQTASTFMRAGSSVTVPAAGVSVLTAITADTAVYGAATGLVAQVGLDSRVGTGTATDAAGSDPVFKIGASTATLVQLGGGQGVAGIALSLGRGITRRPDLTVVANGFAAGQIGFSVDDTAETAALLWPTVFAAGGLYRVEIGPLGTATGMPKITGTARVTSAYLTGPQLLRYQVRLTRSGPVTVAAY